MYYLYNITNYNRRFNKGRFLFICGCPRSGTTVVWRILSKHPKLGLGIERYINKVDGYFIELTKDLFEKERFFNLTKGDTHFSDLISGESGRYYSELFSRYNDCTFVGDKLPILYKNYNGLFYRFPKSRVIFIYRDVFDVANSFMNRYLDEDDDWLFDYKDAVKKWNDSLIITYKFKRKKMPIFCINYNELFSEDYNLEKLFLELNLNYSKSVITSYKNTYLYSKRIEQNRPQVLTDKQIAYIQKKANFEIYNKIKSISNTFY